MKVKGIILESQNGKDMLETKENSVSTLLTTEIMYKKCIAQFPHIVGTHVLSPFPSFHREEN